MYSENVTISMKATEKYCVTLIFVMLYKVILIFVPVTQNPEV